LKLAMNGKDLAPDGKTLIARPTVDNPKGDGDPDAVTCRTPVEIIDSTSRFKRRGPAVCRTNRFWADARMHHTVIDAYGVGGSDVSSSSLAELAGVFGSAYGPEANFKVGSVGAP
jgi:hypothetical protein